jgi:hypothetical protein
MKIKTLWSVKFEGKTFPVTIAAESFLEAVAKATKMSEKIVSVQYLAY